MTPFPKAEARIKCDRKKTRVSTVLTDIPENVALEIEVEARSKPVTCNRLFSDGQEK
jgi:hypothetical protein